MFNWVLSGTLTPTDTHATRYAKVAGVSLGSITLAFVLLSMGISLSAPGVDASTLPVITGLFGAAILILILLLFAFKTPRLAILLRHTAMLALLVVILARVVQYAAFPRGLPSDTPAYSMLILVLPLLSAIVYRDLAPVLVVFLVDQVVLWSATLAPVTTPRLPYVLYNSMLVSTLDVTILICVVIAHNFGALSSADAHLATSKLDAAEAQCKLDSAATAAKTRFISVMSHELLNPMQALQLQVEMLDLLNKQPKCTPYIQGIVHTCNCLLRVVHDVLDVSKLETGVESLVEEPFDLERVCERVIVRHAQELYAKGVDIAFEYPPAVSSKVVGDASRVESIIEKLLDNARKFTAVGEITVRLVPPAILLDTVASSSSTSGDSGKGSRTQGSGGATGRTDRGSTSHSQGNSGGMGMWARFAQYLWRLGSRPRSLSEGTDIRAVELAAHQDAVMWRIVVEDTGIGIPPEGIAKLFQEFAQVDESVTREYGGTGLGLYVCKALATLMHGDITVASRVGEGSTFTAHLPLAAQPPRPAESSSSTGSQEEGSASKGKRRATAPDTRAKRTFRQVAKRIDTGTLQVYVCFSSPSTCSILVHKLRGYLSRVPQATVSAASSARSLANLLDDKMAAWDRHAMGTAPRNERIWVLVGDDELSLSLSHTLVAGRRQYPTQVACSVFISTDTPKMDPLLQEHAVRKPVFRRMLTQAAVSLPGQFGFAVMRCSDTESSAEEEETSEGKRKASSVARSSVAVALPHAMGPSARPLLGGAQLSFSPNTGIHGTLRKRVVLVVEPFELARELLGDMLSAYNFVVLHAASGQKGLTRVRGSYSTVAGILVAQRMPAMDGLAFARAVRKWESKQGVPQAAWKPMVGLTPSTRPAAGAACLEAGMDATVSKPVRAERLYEVLDGLLQAAAQVAPKGAVVGDAATSTTLLGDPGCGSSDGSTAESMMGGSATGPGRRRTGRPRRRKKGSVLGSVV